MEQYPYRRLVAATLLCALLIVFSVQFYGEWTPRITLEESYSPVHVNPCNQTFDELALSLATDGVVILATFQDNFHMWISNWLVFIRYVGRSENVLLIGATRRDCSPLWTMNLRCFAHEDLWESRHRLVFDVDPLARHCGIAINLKWYYTLRLLKLGLNPIFSDLDIAFLRDPMLLVNTRFDTLGLSDFCTPLDRDTWSRPWSECGLYNGTAPCQSTGLVYYQNTTASVKYVESVWDYISHNPEWEQSAANRILATYIKSGRLKHRFFDDHTAANCGIFRKLELPWRVMTEGWIAIHVGFVHGAENKITVFRDLGLWFPDPTYANALARPFTGELPRVKSLTWCGVNDCG